MSADGFVTVPRDRPGIGVEVNVARVEALTRRSETIAAAGVRVPA